MNGAVVLKGTDCVEGKAVGLFLLKVPTFWTILAVGFGDSVCHTVVVSPGNGSALFDGNFNGREGHVFDGDSVGGLVIFVGWG